MRSYTHMPTDISYKLHKTKDIRDQIGIEKTDSNMDYPTNAHEAVDKRERYPEALILIVSNDPQEVIVKRGSSQNNLLHHIAENVSSDKDAMSLFGDISGSEMGKNTLRETLYRATNALNAEGKTPREVVNEKSGVGSDRSFAKALKLFEFMGRGRLR